MTRLEAPTKRRWRSTWTSPTYGAFAEIGGGQEVARWFFRVGGAAGTVAKDISAYDTAVSDALYGSAPRYVSRRRVEAMLEQEFGQLLEHLGASRGDITAFFAFAETVATRSYGATDTRRAGAGGWASGSRLALARSPPRSSCTSACSTPPRCASRRRLRRHARRHARSGRAASQRQSDRTGAEGHYAAAAGRIAIGSRRRCSTVPHSMFRKNASRYRPFSVAL